MSSLLRRGPRLATLMILAGTAAASAPFVPVAVPAPPPPLHAVSAPVPSGPCRGSAFPDFDGDGRADLAAAAPHAAVHGLARAGRVAVTGAAGTAWLSAGASAGRGDGYGAALAAGDFDRDGCDDLAVGVPDRTPGARRPGAEGAGAVVVHRGSRAGLRAAWTLTVRDLGRRPGTDRFGAALAAADLDGDRDDELVVGVPGLRGGGGVAVFGLRGRGLRPGPVVTQGTAWVGQNAAQTDGFGTVLAAGDVDGDERDEIVVGVPGDGAKGQGSVTVLDPLQRRADYVAQDQPGVDGDPERGDAFGAALAVADFDGDGDDDIAVGVPGENRAAHASFAYHEGAVQILDGSSRTQLGPTRTGRGRSGRHDRFGSALAAGDLTGDGVPELAVGAPGRGAVRVLRGRRGRVPAPRGGTTLAPPLGRFGDALAIRDRTLIVGAPGAHGFGGAVATVRGVSGRAAVLALPAGGLLGYAVA